MSDQTVEIGSIKGDDYKAVSEILVEYFYETLEKLGLVPSLNGIMNFIRDNKQSKQSGYDSDGNPPDPRIKYRLKELISFLMECFDQRMEIMFFFKNCAFNFDLNIGDFT